MVSVGTSLASASSPCCVSNFFSSFASSGSDSESRSIPPIFGDSPFNLPVLADTTSQKSLRAADFVTFFQFTITAFSVVHRTDETPL